MSDKIFIDPTDSNLTDYIRSAVASVQGGSRQRLVAANEISDCVRSATASAWHGWSQVDGGGVANSYGYLASTTRLGIAWWTDASGRRHVRVAIDRHGISGRHVSCVLGNARTMDTCHPAQRVYPFLAVPTAVFSGRGEQARQERAFLRAIKEDPADLAAWQMYSDWLADQGQMASAERIWATVLKIEAIALPSVAVAV